MKNLRSACIVQVDFCLLCLAALLGVGSATTASGQTEQDKSPSKLTSQSPDSPIAKPIALDHWKLTLPVDKAGVHAGHASEISAAQLTAGFSSPYFQVDSNGSLQFWCPVIGAKTEGTEYPRSELRELLDPNDPSKNWTTKGTHTLSACCRIIEVSDTAKVIIGQIHSYSGKAKPLVKLQYNKGRIEALVKASPEKGKDIKLEWPSIDLGSVLRYRIKLHDGQLTITVNGIDQSQGILKNDPAWGNQLFYFKAGVYVQDNQGPPTEGARVTFSELSVTHASVDNAK